ncbi:lipase family protein [Duganella vulcania]|uniref:Fungal lipase-type domain-containing protein n=1 Tax=Duganella vulcania TaxID=2692166 RepID=A0A845GD46_9BURK|nr:hypothetical protein [Duganella vulcania]MYM92543.1 hypothetical protein [Duganella vulcania]
MKNRFYQIAPLAVLACAAGCGTTAPASMAGASVEESAHTSAGWSKKTLPADEVISLMRRLDPYAEMADATYRHEFPSAKDRLQQGCDYVASGDPKTLTLNLPEGWQRLDNAVIKRLHMDSGPEPLQPCQSGRGLDYETYIHLDAAGQPLQAVIAFRGTENTKYQWREDWIANFSNIDFGLGTNQQFAQTRIQGARLVQALATVLPKVASSPTCKAASNGAENAQAPIDLVGHSLGGGLAQHLAYYSKACDVRKTVTFDTSPANGWFFLKQRGEIKTRDPIIERVYTDGEILAYIRKVSTKFNMVRNNRLDYRIDFAGVKGLPIHLHSMTLLSDKIHTNSGAPLEDERVYLADDEAKKVYPEVAGMDGTE